MLQRVSAALGRLPAIGGRTRNQAVLFHAAKEMLHDRSGKTQARLQVGYTDACGFFQSECLQDQMREGLDRLGADGVDRRFDPVHETVADPERVRLVRLQLPPPAGHDFAAGKNQGRGTIHERLHAVPERPGSLCPL